MEWKALAFATRTSLILTSPIPRNNLTFVVIDLPGRNIWEIQWKLILILDEKVYMYLDGNVDGGKLSVNLDGRALPTFFKFFIYPHTSNDPFGHLFPTFPNPLAPGTSRFKFGDASELKAARITIFVTFTMFRLKRN